MLLLVVLLLVAIDERMLHLCWLIMSSKMRSRMRMRKIGHLAVANRLAGAGVLAGVRGAHRHLDRCFAQVAPPARVARAAVVVEAVLAVAVVAGVDGWALVCVLVQVALGAAPVLDARAEEGAEQDGAGAAVLARTAIAGRVHNCSRTLRSAVAR